MTVSRPSVFHLYVHDLNVSKTGSDHSFFLLCFWQLSIKEEQWAGSFKSFFKGYCQQDHSHGHCRNHTWPQYMASCSFQSTFSASFSLQRSIKGKNGLGCFIIEGVVNFIEKMCLLPSLLLIWRIWRMLFLSMCLDEFLNSTMFLKYVSVLRTLVTD